MHLRSCDIKEIKWTRAKWCVVLDIYSLLCRFSSRGIRRGMTTLIAMLEFGKLNLHTFSSRSVQVSSLLVQVTIFCLWSVQHTVFCSIYTLYPLRKRINGSIFHFAGPTKKLRTYSHLSFTYTTHSPCMLCSRAI